MARFVPFRGIRYSGVDLQNVVAPPYDVINENRRRDLLARHPLSVLSIDMPEQDAAGYRSAASTLALWIEQGHLKIDSTPSFYLYRMDFFDERNQARHTVGVIGALELSEPAEGHILPHEQTTPKAKTDRLELLRATHTNTSAIWGLTPAKGLSELLPAEGAPAGEWIASDGVRHRYWPLTNHDQIESISALIETSPILIADGHHRFETSLNYRREHTEATHVMTFVVELSSDELTVQPIHRLIRGLPAGFDLASALERCFDLTECDAFASDLPAMMAANESLALLWKGHKWLMRPLPEAMAGVRDLDSSRLDRALEALPPHTLSFQHGVAHVEHELSNDQADAGVLLRPVPLDAIAAIARGGERMPPKSTYFHPKPSTGAVFMRVRD